MSNGINHVTRRHKSMHSSESSSAISESAIFSDFPASDLEDMFTSNLRLLERLETQRTTDSNNHLQFQSSLNVYINHPIDQKQLTNNTGPLANSKRCSSYESLYDNLFLRQKTVTNETGLNPESMTQSEIANSKGSIDDYLKFGSNISLDSEKTLKSFSSNDSSDVSSLELVVNNLELSGSNQSLPTCQSMSNEIHLHTKLRPNPERPFSRPMSYHQGDAQGYYYSNKPPTYPFKKEGTYAPANVIISRSHVTPSLISQNCTSRNIPNNNINNNDNNKYHTNNNGYNNIINNQSVSVYRQSSNQMISSISATPPIVPPRHRTKIIMEKSKTKAHESIPSVSETTTTNGPVKSSINLNVGSHGKTFKSNGMKVHRQTQNYDNEFSYPESRLNCISYCKTTDIRRTNHNS